MTADQARTRQGGDSGERVAVMLTQAEIGWALSALASAAADTIIHLSRVPSQPHDPCCEAEARRQTHRDEIHQAFLQQRRQIESAMQALEAVEVRDVEEPSR